TRICAPRALHSFLHDALPISRATRVTSEAKEESWSTIVLTIFAVRWNSPARGRPSSSIAMLCDRSPFATAPITRPVSLIGCTRRSEEHTSELQSRVDLVCRLL